MKKFVSFILSIAFVMTLCAHFAPSYAMEIEPRYTIETVDITLSVPITIPQQIVTVYGGQDVQFPSYETYCDVVCSVDLDTRNGSIVRASVKSSGVNPLFTSAPLPDLYEMTINSISVSNSSNCIQIAADKKSFQLNIDVVASVNYVVIFVSTQPPVTSYDGVIDFELSGFAEYETA